MLTSEYSEYTVLISSYKKEKKKKRKKFINLKKLPHSYSLSKVGYNNETLKKYHNSFKYFLFPLVVKKFYIISEGKKR
jgi:hypothetical protein